MSTASRLSHIQINKEFRSVGLFCRATKAKSVPSSRKANDDGRGDAPGLHIPKQPQCRSVKNDRGLPLVGTLFEGGLRKQKSACRTVIFVYTMTIHLFPEE
jgi:hypothetical protein